MKEMRRHLRKHLEKLRRVKKSRYHHLTHKLHKKYRISKKTLLYAKEYGPHTNILKTIIKESILVLLFASVLSSFGGFALENIKTVFVSIIPLIILLPVLNDMIGNFSIIISSRFATLLHEGRDETKWYKDKEVTTLLFQIVFISIFMAILSSCTASAVSYFAGYALNKSIVYKVILISVIDVLLLVCILFLVAVSAGLYFYRKNEDPDNFLIPITTSIADFGNMILLAVLVVLFF